MKHLATPLEGKPRPLHRLTTAILACFFLQLGLIWFLGDRPKPAQPPEVFQTEIFLATDKWPSSWWEELPHVQDPALVPLPNQHGFSGDAWLRFSPLTYTPKEWTENPQWLALEMSQLGQTLHQWTLRTVVHPTRIADRPVPDLAVDDLVVASLLPPAESGLLIEGDLAARKLISPLSLPSWPHNDILTNTVVQVAVRADGLVFSSALLSSCGLAEADLSALATARTVRFDPAPASPGPGRAALDSLTFGKLVFLWHTRSPPPPLNTAQMNP